jgi:quinohemoprotein amine dehydrogenase
LFTPALDGPNPQRSGNRNNVGDVWVVATYRPAADATPMRARAHLVVTVPLYMRWDFSTVNQR